MNNIMPFDADVETSLEIAEKLLEQEHIINMKRIEILSKMMIKLANKHPKLKEFLEPELSRLIELEESIRELESTSMYALSPS